MDVAAVATIFRENAIFLSFAFAGMVLVIVLYTRSWYKEWRSIKRYEKLHAIHPDCTMIKKHLPSDTYTVILQEEVEISYVFKGLKPSRIPT
ncbi:hypothetical protein [Brevibacillus reuszeri]|uniref:hypothetical protein n=1 Tax=Brevibacillus reuszeri TaxID=54915 RepID=UPI000CCC8D16|nr:hypothetical protein [Brevibacillus reuszeri]